MSPSKYSVAAPPELFPRALLVALWRPGHRPPTSRKWLEKRYPSLVGRVEGRRCVPPGEVLFHCPGPEEGDLPYLALVGAPKKEDPRTLYYMRCAVRQIAAFRKYVGLEPPEVYLDPGDSLRHTKEFLAANASVSNPLRMNLMRRVKRT